MVVCAEEIMHDEFGIMKEESCQRSAFGDPQLREERGESR